MSEVYILFLKDWRIKFMYFSSSELHVTNNFASSAGVVVVSGFHISTVVVVNQIRKIMVERMAQTDYVVCDKAPDVS